MKKIFLGISVFLAALVSAQNYPDYYPSNNDFTNNYGDEEDAYYFPEDYYYEYPSDYYTNSFYESSYNDYRQSINEINWNRFFSRNRLSPWQIQQIIRLNDLYPSFSSWDYYYRYNPDRWYYDRYYALEIILGPRVFVVFQNNYYNGYSPVNYYRSYSRQHYAPTVYIVPRYRNINVNRYRVDRNQYHQNNPRNNFGFRDTPRQGSGTYSPNQSGFRDDQTLRKTDQNNGFRNNGASPLIKTPNTGNGGFRNDSSPKAETTIPRNNGTREYNSGGNPQPSAPQNNGFRNRDSGSSQVAPSRSFRNNSGSPENVKPAPAAPSAGSRSSGMRFTSQ